TRQAGELPHRLAPAAPGRSRRAPDDTGRPPAASAAPASETVLRARPAPDRRRSPPRGSGPPDRRLWLWPERSPVIRSRSRGARHRVLHELDARQVSRELPRGGAAAAQKTDETEKPNGAVGVHGSRNRPVLKS